MFEEDEDAGTWTMVWMRKLSPTPEEITPPPDEEPVAEDAQQDDEIADEMDHLHLSRTAPLEASTHTNVFSAENLEGISAERYAVFLRVMATLMSSLLLKTRQAHVRRNR